MLGAAGTAMWVQYIYIVLTVAMGIAAIVKGAVYPGIAGLIGPTICWFAGAGLKGSLLVGTGSQKLGGLATAIVFLVIGFGVVYHSGYWVSIFGYDVTGVAWCAIGLAAGFLFTKKKYALG
jgi:hypothetical protein